MSRKTRVAVLGLSIVIVVALGACSDDSISSGSADESYYEPGGEDTGRSSYTDAGSSDYGGPSYDTSYSSPDSGTYADAAYDASSVEIDEEEPDASEEPNNDQYEDPGTNPFVVSAHDPLSTFAADVDTASYDIFRRDINRGTLPHSASVRLEEYVNAFEYDYEPPPEDAVTPFSISLTAAPSPVSETILLGVGIQGREAAFERKPANLVFLIDTSGSMSSSDKLDLVKLVLTEALEVLQPADTVAIVTYAGHTAVRLEPTEVSDAETIRAAINGLQSGGGTAGASGIELAYEQAEDGFKEGGINHVILCTDGDFNVGVSNTDALVELIEEKRRSGITLTVLGFGYGNLNDAMMEAITNAGNGIYAVISDRDHAVDYAHNDLLATILHIAKDMKIQVEFNAAIVYAYRLLGYENRALQDDQFRDDTVDAGEIGSGHTVTALYELVLVGDEIPTAEGAPEVLDGESTDEEVGIFADELCRVRIRYKGVNASEEDPAFETELGITPVDMLSSFSDGNSNYQWAAAIAAFAEILKESPYAHPERIETIQSIVDAHAGTAADRLEFKGLFETARMLLPE